MEGDIITLQDMFVASFADDKEPDNSTSKLVYTGIRPSFIEKLERHGVDTAQVVLRGHQRERRRASPRPARAGRTPAEDGVSRRRATAAAIAGWPRRWPPPQPRRAPPPSLASGCVTRAGPNAVRVVLHAPGNLTTTGVSARLGPRWAYVRSVTPVGEHRPLNLVIAIDTSRQHARSRRSMRRWPPPSKLLDAVTPADRVGLVTFAGRVQVESELTHDVTRRSTGPEPASHRTRHRARRRRYQGSGGGRHQRQGAPAGRADVRRSRHHRPIELPARRHAERVGSRGRRLRPEPLGRLHLDAARRDRDGHRRTVRERHLTVTGGHHHSASRPGAVRRLRRADLAAADTRP